MPGTIWHDVADLDLGVAYPGAVFLCGADRQRGERHRRRCRGENCAAGDLFHLVLLPIGSSEFEARRRRASQAAVRRTKPAAPDGIRKISSSRMTPYTAPERPVETFSAMLGTNSTKTPPNRLPGIEPMPPTISPTRKFTDNRKLKLSGATNWTTIAPSAPAMPV